MTEPDFPGHRKIPRGHGRLGDRAACQRPGFKSGRSREWWWKNCPLLYPKLRARKGLDLEVVTLSPCFAYHDRRKMVPLDIHLPVTLDGHTFAFQAYENIFPDGQKVVYFWDELQLGWTTPTAIYPLDPHMACRLYAAVCQAMAGYIRQENFRHGSSARLPRGSYPFLSWGFLSEEDPHTFYYPQCVLPGHHPIDRRRLLVPGSSRVFPENVFFINILIFSTILTS